MKNYELIEDRFINELDTNAKFYVHKNTGAEILFLSNNDDNKCFGVALKTPPSDSTGIAHILEHTVLCGSKKYPLKDPFVQLLKGSLQTFLNAFTYPDKTCYPVASQNLQDFYNLTDVYLDAVFFPLLSEDFFKQEGWHYFLEDIDDDLEYKGVVYNEMKGVYSSPDSILMETSQQSLFPDTTYGLDSGGNPEKIPELTYGNFIKFHKLFYHPSNARFVFYGDDPEKNRFQILDKYLSLFTKTNPNSEISKQIPFMTPSTITRLYAISEDVDDPKSMFTINWALPSPTNIDDIFIFTILDYILLGTPASPLRKALIESGLGEDLTGGGLETHLKQMVFVIGLKGIEKNKINTAEKLIFKTLNELVNYGISDDDIQAALNSFEFDLRENNTGGFPRGLSLWLKSLNGWIYGANPIDLISFESPLKLIREKSSKEGFYENIIQKYFISNNHRSIVLLHPSDTLSEKIENKEKEKLRKIKNGMTKHQLLDIQQKTNQLLELQNKPDSDEAIATLPLLKRSDLENKIKTLTYNQNNINSIEITEHPLFTNGVLYLDISFDLQFLNPQELPLASLLSNLYLEMGTNKEDYSSLSKRIAMKTGGINGSPFISPLSESDQSVKRFFIRGKCMNHQSNELLNIFTDIFLEANFENKERFKQILLEQKSEMETMIVPRGHSAIMTRLKARDHEAHLANEQIGGIDALFFLRNLIEDVEKNWDDVHNTLKVIHRKLIHSKSIKINITSDQNTINEIRPLISNFCSTIPLNSIDSLHIQKLETTYPKDEALIIPSRINFVGASSNLYNYDYNFHGSSLVITRYLQTAWLWEKIRVQGGAYGGMCSFDYRSGSFVFASYRDPNLLDSIEVYKNTGNFLKNLKLSEDELTRSIIGAIGQLDSYQLPDAKSLSNYQRMLINYTDQERQKLRNEVLSTSKKDFQKFGDVLSKAFKDPNILVLCDNESANEANIRKLTNIF